MAEKKHTKNLDTPSPPKPIKPSFDDNCKLGTKASCVWDKGRTLKYYKLFNYKGVSFWLIRMAYPLITACPYAYQICDFDKIMMFYCWSQQTPCNGDNSNWMRNVVCLFYLYQDWYHWIIKWCSSSCHSFALTQVGNVPILNSRGVGLNCIWCCPNQHGSTVTQYVF